MKRYLLVAKMLVFSPGESLKFPFIFNVINKKLADFALAG
jgi:hypothetical protein